MKICLIWWSLERYRKSILVSNIFSLLYKINDSKLSYCKFRIQESAKQIKHKRYLYTFYKYYNLTVLYILKTRRTIKFDDIKTKLIIKTNIK